MPLSSSNASTFFILDPLSKPKQTNKAPFQQSTSRTHCEINFGIQKTLGAMKTYACTNMSFSNMINDLFFYVSLAYPAFNIVE